MDVGRRAKQFAPFAALRGLDETIRQQEIIYEPKRDLSEEKKNELDMKLRSGDGLPAGVQQLPPRCFVHEPADVLPAGQLLRRVCGKRRRLWAGAEKIIS